MPGLADFSDQEITGILMDYAAMHDLRYVSYWDDGEWHAHMFHADEPIATAEGDNNRAADEALLRLLGLG